MLHQSKKQTCQTRALFDLGIQADCNTPIKTEKQIPKE